MIMSTDMPEPTGVDSQFGGRFQGFQNLMRKRIQEVLLVSSLYDLYLFEEDGRLYELILHEYQGLRLSHSPELTRVSSAREAIALARQRRRFDLIITTLHIEDVSAIQFADMVKEEGLNIPIVLLAYDSRQLKELITHENTSEFARVYLWQGDFRLIVAISKNLEDQMNVEEDTAQVGVQSIILIEDNVAYYSSFLPLIYTEILNQSQRLVSEGVSLSDKYLRLRARPKILLCTNFEEAWACFTKYEEFVLGIISDVDFQRNGVADPRAGMTFARMVKDRHQDIPILLQSTTPEHREDALALECSYVLKDSPTLLNDVRHFITEYFSFGDFVFRVKGGAEVARASDLQELEDQLQHVPEASIQYHAEHNHFSNWLKARTEFWLADKLRPRKVSDYPSVEALRQDLISSLREYRQLRQRGIITDFSKETFLPGSSFARIGGGSLGGKARGLGFVNVLLNNFDMRERFEDARISVPPAIVCGTEVFDKFLDANNLRNFALNATDDEEIAHRFLQARKFPGEILDQLSDFLDLVREPLAVRSSSLLEDSQYHPFAGVYATYMIPNNHKDARKRLGELVNTIKRVYASMYFQSAKDYFRVTSYRLEEEKMAVILQKMVGAPHGIRFYPDISGVAKSFNFYPLGPQRAEDGIVSAALGLGKWVVDGGVTVRFCPKHPAHLLQNSGADDSAGSWQTRFYALELTGHPLEHAETYDALLKTYPLDVAEEDRTLSYVGSTYSVQNDTVSDGIARDGVRVVSFAPVLRNKVFPLPKIIDQLLDMASKGMGAPVEIEFAVTMSVPPDSRKEFGILQMRPLVLSREVEEMQIEGVPQEEILCSSHQVLGNGIVDDIHDIVFVDPDKFDRSKTVDVAREVMSMNESLIADRRPYVLIGMGRWGTLDPWLGIPVRWDQISGARAIVETGLTDVDVLPSQGSHFFQNLTSFMVGYFTVHSRLREGFLDWEWLKEQSNASASTYLRHIRTSKPLRMIMNGRKNNGLILKPGTRSR